MMLVENGTEAAFLVPLRLESGLMHSSGGSTVAQLLDRARKGDETALGQLLDMHRQTLTHLARFQIGQRLQSKVDASDVVQEACLGAVRDFGQFRGGTPGELAAWLRQVLAHVLSNLIRHYQGAQQRDIRLERQISSELDRSWAALDRAYMAQVDSPSDLAARNEMSELVEKALQLMPEEERKVIVLRHREGLTFPEVAERMERTLDNIKKLWPRALARLRRLVKEPSDEGKYSCDPG